MRNVVVTKQTIRDRLTYKGILMVDVTIAYPQIGGDLPQRCAREFNRHYDRLAHRLYRHAKEGMYREAVKQYEYSVEKGYPFNNYVLMQVYEVTYNVLPVLSLYADVYEYTGGAHGNTNRTGSTWNLYACRQLAMRDLFKRGYNYKEPILKYALEEALRRQATGEVSYFDDLPENMRKYFEEQNFYLTYPGLAVFYPLYTIGPYYIGIQVFTVPYGVFGNNLAYPLITLV